MTTQIAAATVRSLPPALPPQLPEHFRARPRSERRSTTLSEAPTSALRIGPESTTILSGTTSFRSAESDFILP
jgi:hypothetical protein